MLQNCKEIPVNIQKLLKTLQSLILMLYFFTYVTINQMESNKDIFDKAIGRPAMMGFLLLMGTYLVTGQLIPGWF